MKEIVTGASQYLTVNRAAQYAKDMDKGAATAEMQRPLVDLGDASFVQQKKVIQQDPLSQAEFQRRAEQAQAAKLWEKYVEEKRNEGVEISQQTVDKMVAIAVPPKIWEQLYKNVADAFKNTSTKDEKSEDGEEKKPEAPSPTSFAELVVHVAQQTLAGSGEKTSDKKKQEATEKKVEAVVGGAESISVEIEEKIKDAVIKGKDAGEITNYILEEQHAEKEKLVKQQEIQRATGDRMQYVTQGRERITTLMEEPKTVGELQVIARILASEVENLAKHIPVLEEDPEFGERFVDVQKQRIDDVLSSTETAGEMQDGLRSIVDDVYTTYLSQFPEDRSDETEALTTIQDIVDVQEAKDYISASEAAASIINVHKQETEVEEQRIVEQAEDTLAAVSDILKEDRQRLDTDITSKGVLTRTRGEVLNNAGIDTKGGRQEKAKEILDALALVSDDEKTKAFTGLTEDQLEGIWEIHEIGTGGVFGYEQKDITAKARKAAELGFTKQQTRALMEAGIWGNLPTPDEFTDPRIQGVARNMQDFGEPVPPEDLRAGLGRLHGLMDSNQVDPQEARRLESQLSSEVAAALQKSRQIEQAGVVRDRYVQELIEGRQIPDSDLYERPTMTLRELMNKLQRQVEGTTQENFARENYQKLQSIAQKALNGQLPGTIGNLSPESRQQLEAMVQTDPNSLQTVDAIKAATRSLMDHGWTNEIPQGMAARPEGDRRSDPESFEDLIDLLMTQEDPKWREGELALMKDGEVQAHNFVAWVRDRMMYFRGMNPDDPIQLFKDISIRTTYRDISFMDLMNKAQYFRKKVSEGTYVEDTSYKRLKDHLLYEVWLFEVSHNNDANYRLFMGVDSVQDGVLKQIKGIHYKNQFSADKNRILRTLRLPTISKDEVDHALESDILTKQGTVGKAIRRTLMAYNYMSEAPMGAKVDGKDVVGRLSSEGNINMFEKAIGGEAGAHIFYDAIIKQLLEEKYQSKFNELNHRHEASTDPDVKGKGFDLWETDPTKSGYELSRKYREEFMQVVQEAHVRDFLGTSTDHKKELAYKLLGQYKGKDYQDLNIFNKPKSMKPLNEYVRKGLIAVMAKQYGLSGNEASYAVNWANSMVYWTGISAKNDTSAIGHDALTKVLRTSEYRRRQIDRFAKAGDLENMFVVKMPGMDFLTAAKGRIESGAKAGQSASLIEWLQGGTGTDMHLENDIAEIELEGNAQRLYAEDHLQNAFMLYEWLVRSHGFKFDQFISHDPKEPWRVVVDQEKMDGAVRDVYRAIRYTFNNYNIDYNQTVRLWEKEEQIVDGKLVLTTVFKEKKLGEFVFGEDAFKFFQLHSHHEGGHGGGHGEEHGIDYTDDPAKKVLMGLFAAEFRKHRNWENQDTYWDEHTVHIIEQALLGVPFQVSENKRDKGDTRLNPQRGFFDHHEIELMLKMSRSTKWDFFSERLIAEGGAAVLMSIWGLVEELLEGMKDAVGVKGGGGRGGGHH